MNKQKQKRAWQAGMVVLSTLQRALLEDERRVAQRFPAFKDRERRELSLLHTEFLRMIPILESKEVGSLFEARARVHALNARLYRFVGLIEGHRALLCDAVFVIPGAEPTAEEHTFERAYDRVREDDLQQKRLRNLAQAMNAAQER